MRIKQAAAALAVAGALAVPAVAQTVRPSRTHSRGTHPARSSVSQHIFVPNFGLRPVIRERFPVFGLGFDAHHFHTLRRHHGLQFGVGGKNFFFKGSFGTGFVPFGHPAFFTSFPSVVVVPQAVPVQSATPIIIQIQDRDSQPQERETVPAPTGLPPNWSRLRVAPPSYAQPSQRPVSHLTLLVLEDETILAVADYWLEEGRIFYVTSTGRQDSVAVRDLDWEMTRQLNADRHVTFVLRNRH